MEEVVIYARGHNAEALDRQLQELRAFAQSSGYTVTDEFTDVGSALKRNRPGLRQLEAKVFDQEGREDGIVLIKGVESISRDPNYFGAFILRAHFMKFRLLAPNSYRPR